MGCLRVVRLRIVLLPRFLEYPTLLEGTPVYWTIVWDPPVAAPFWALFVENQEETKDRLFQPPQSQTLSNRELFTIPFSNLHGVRCLPSSLQTRRTMTRNSRLQTCLIPSVSAWRLEIHCGCGMYKKCPRVYIACLSSHPLSYFGLWLCARRFITP